jgi:hypothetical protein
VLGVLPERFLWPQFLAALGLMAMPLAALGWRIVGAARLPALQPNVPSYTAQTSPTREGEER